jgi:hypothetical protein
LRRFAALTHFSRPDFMTTISSDPHDDAAPAAANAAANGVPHLKTSDEPIRLVTRSAADTFQGPVYRDALIAMTRS